MNSKKKVQVIIADILLLLVMILIDQVVKFYISHNIQENKSVSLIKGIFEFYYIKNSGAAFGILKNQSLLFILIALIVLLVVTYLLFKFPIKQKFTICRFFLVMIAAGTIGNMIDRILYQSVIDFIYISIIHFPIFNIADIYVTVSTIGLIILFLFRYKEDDLSFISFKTKKFRDLDNMEH